MRTGPAPHPNRFFLLHRLAALVPRGASAGAIALVAGVGVLGYRQTVPNDPLVALVTTAVLLAFFRRMDEGVPLLQLTTLVACLQWLVGPMLVYATGRVAGRYEMYVGEEDYFGYALPATCAFVLGALASGASVRQRALLAPIDRSHFFRVGVILQLVSMLADGPAEGVMPGGMGFFIHLLSQLRYVGAIYFLLSRHPFRWVLAAAACIPLVLRSAESSLFHDLILWGTLILLYWLASGRRSHIAKSLILLTGCLTIVAIQLVKQKFRATNEFGGASISTSAQSLATRGVGDTEIALALARLNQGWIVSAVLANVPRSEPFAGGSTILEAVQASAVPRLLWADKKEAGGRNNFRRFTGLPVADSTSMCISVLGEAYANFGREGGIAFMAVYGLAFSLAFLVVVRHSLNHPSLLLWVPLIFYQAIKAETELVVVLNHVVKGGVVALGMYHFVLPLLVPKPATVHRLSPLARSRRIADSSR